MVEATLGRVDVTAIFNDYRSCCRDLWNLYVHRINDLDEWEVSAPFEAMRRHLFDVLIYPRIVGYVESQVGCPDDVDLFVVPSVQRDFGGNGAPIRIAENEGDHGGSYWNEEPRFVLAEDVSLAYLDICDWAQIGYRDMALYRAEIKELRGFPHLHGRHALLEAAYVRVIAVRR